MSVGLALLSFLSVAFGSAGVTYHGRLLKPTGEPVSSTTVDFKIQIRSPGNENCLMYEEVQRKDLSASNGVFAITINDGSGAVSPGNFSLDRVFQNRGAFTFSAGKCVINTPYTPNAADGRRLTVEFDDGTGWEPMPAQAINFVPMSLEAMTVGGYNAGSLLRVEDPPVMGITPLANAQYNTLLDLVNGTSTQYLQPTSTLDGSRLSAGSVGSGSVASLAWSKLTGVPAPLAQIGGLACADGKILKTASGSWTCADETGGGGGLPAAGGANGKYLKSDGTNWAGANVTFADIKNSVGGSAFNLAGCAANQTVSWSSLTDMFTCQNIGSLDGAAITSGTIASARLPAGASMWQDGGSGKIYYSGGNIGVGTSDPASAIEIAKAGAKLIINESAGGNPILNWRQSGVNKIDLFYSGSYAELYNYGAVGAQQRWYDNGNIYLNGNVGIGITNPTERLSVFGGNSRFTGADSDYTGMEIRTHSSVAPWHSPYLTLKRGRGTAAAPSYPLVNDQLGVVSFRNYNGVGNGAGMQAFASQNHSASAEGTDLYLFTTPNGTTAAAPRMFIGENGSVGIGTTAPWELLDVQATGSSPTIRVASTGGGSSYPNMTIQNFGTGLPQFTFKNANGTQAAPTASVTGDWLGTIGFMGHSGTGTAFDQRGVGNVGIVAVVDANFGANSYPTSMKFYTTPSGTDMSAERMRIDSDGNIGIGTTSAAAKLVVNGAAINNGAIANATATIDFSKGNLQYTTSSCGTFALHYLKNGGSYTFAVQGGTSAVCAFNAFSDAGVTGLTMHLPPDHAATVASTHTVYTFLVMGTHVYASWVPGL